MRRDSFVLALVVLVLAALPARAFFAGPMPGWEKGGTYDAYYDAAKMETLKGVLNEYVSIRPLSGMAEGLGLNMTTRDGEKVAVHLGPQQYLDFLPEVIVSGDRIKVKGAFADIKGKRVFMASKIRKGEVFELKLRSTRTGSPYWSMDATERFEETLEQ